jgi:hypothetical protein
MARTGRAAEGAEIAFGCSEQPRPAAAEDRLTVLEDGGEIRIADEKGVGERSG